MKKLVCEMCGSNDLIKQDGLFVCQNCGTKYSPEEAKKMMVELDGPVEVTGKVTISKNLETILKMADDAYKNGNYQEAYKYYTEYIEQNPNDYEIQFKRYLSYGSGITLVKVSQLDGLMNYIDEYCTCVEKDEKNDENVIKAKVLIAFAESFTLLNSVFALARSIYVDSGICSSSSHNDFLNYAEFVITRQILLYRLMEKHLYYCLELEEIWTSHYKVISKELDYCYKKYKFNDTTFSLTRAGKKTFDPLYDENKNNKRRFPELLIATKQKIQKDRNEKYWEEHKDLKEDLLSEKEIIEKNNNEGRKNIDAINQEIDKIKSQNKFNSADFDKEIGSLTSEIDQKQKEKAELGLFKVKEKSAIKKQIKDLEVSLNDAKLRRMSAEKDHIESVAKLYASQTEEISKIKKTIETNNERTIQIEHILNADY